MQVNMAGRKRTLSNTVDVQQSRTRCKHLFLLFSFCVVFSLSRASDQCPIQYSLCENWFCPRLPQYCAGNRAGADPCGCCTVCLRQAGERCTIPKQPCDQHFGLYCQNGRCRGRNNLQIRSATDTSINLKWDSFLPENYNNGQYVVYFSKTYSDWIDEWPRPMEVGNKTFASIRNLDSKVDYYFRVSYRLPGHNGVMLEGPLSEVALHRTGTPAPFGGCEHEGEHYDEGMTILQSCDSACDCLLGTWICRPKGCPPGPETTLINPIHCHEIAHPDDPECCSYLQCDEGPHDPDNPASCTRENIEVGRVSHDHGETYYYGCEEVCFCDNGREYCSSRCPDPGFMIPDPDTCPYPLLNPPPDGECCPHWSCPPPQSACDMNGNTYEDGEFFDMGCSMRCHCSQGEVNCVQRCSSFLPPAADCPNPQSIIVPGECCTQWECVETAHVCVIHSRGENITLHHGETFDEPCERHCNCYHGELTCMPYCMTPVLPPSTPLCPHPVITKLRLMDCCDVIACHDPQKESPNVVQDVSLAAFNATSFTVAFSPPANTQLASIMDGYIIYYTNIPDDTDVHNWRVHRKDFPKGVKIQGRIIIEIGNLERDTTYYLQIKVSADIVVQQLPNTLPNTDTIVVTTSENEPQHCTYKGNVYDHNKDFTDGCDAICHCRAGRTVCRERCPKTQLVASELCPDPQLVIVENECCPQWRCFPMGSDCSQNGKIYKNGMEWRKDCDVRCQCNQGSVSCRNICNTTSRNRPNDCKYAIQIPVADTCCKEWLCHSNPPTSHLPTLPVPIPVSSFMLDISVVNVSAYSAIIRWPELGDIQRQYISQFELRYRNLTYGSDQWITTINFRPEIKQYTIMGLRPARSYVVMLVILVGDISSPGTVHLQSNKEEIDTLWIPSEPYPGTPFSLEVLETTVTSITVKWESLPFEIAEDIAGWRLMVMDEDEHSVVESEIVEKSSLSYTINNLVEGQTYHLQLLGLWDNGTVTHEVRSVTIAVTLPISQSQGHSAGRKVFLGLLFFFVILLIPVIVLMYFKIKKRYSKQYDVYSTAINFGNTTRYEDVYEETSPPNLTRIQGGSEDNLLDPLDPVRRDSEAGLLERKQVKRQSLLDKIS